MHQLADAQRPTLGGLGPGKALGNPVLRTEGRVTLIDGILATAYCWAWS